MTNRLLKELLTDESQTPNLLNFYQSELEEAVKIKIFPYHAFSETSAILDKIMDKKEFNQYQLWGEVAEYISHVYQPAMLDKFIHPKNNVDILPDDSIPLYTRLEMLNNSSINQNELTNLIQDLIEIENSDFPNDPTGLQRISFNNLLYKLQHERGKLEFNIYSGATDGKIFFSDTRTTNLDSIPHLKLKPIEQPVRSKWGQFLVSRAVKKIKNLSRQELDKRVYG